MRKVVVLLLVLLLLGAAGVSYLRRESAPTTSFRTAQVQRDNLLVAISATGTVEPEEVIDVGAQVAGRIMSFGKDANGRMVDYRSLVEEGMVLATIDDSVYTAQLTEAQAQVASAQASLQRAEAELDQKKAELYQAERDWQRAQQLGPSEALAETIYDSYKSTYEIAKASVAVSEAAILQAKANIMQMKAGLERAERNLGYCTIVSPVKGMVIARRVNIGQTVVASLNAPSLFLLAKDLTRMQVWVAVNEADVGHIYPGQPVTFTVDAFPGETFTGEVGKVRLDASMTQNVVTYTVEVVTDNSNNRLLPYLTANVQFELSRRKGVLLVPNAALRWTPTSENQVAPAFREPAASSSQAAQDEAAPATSVASSPAGPADATMKEGVIWIADGSYVRPVLVYTGLSDGVLTEVEGEGLKEGDTVVTGLQTSTTETQSETTNPFTPKIPRRGGGGPPPPM